MFSVQWDIGNTGACDYFVVFILPLPTYKCLLFVLSYRQSVQSPSHVQLCDPMDCSTPGLVLELPFFSIHYTIMGK